MAEKVAKKVDMTSGPLLGKIVLFAIPLILSGMLQLLFNAADVVVVGQFAGKESLAAVSSNGPFVNLIVNLFVGFSVGANVVIAKAIGAKRYEKVERTVHASILLALISGVFIAIIGQFIAEPVLKLMKVTSDVIAKSSLYVKIYFLGSPAVLLFNFGSSILRAKGDTKRPLYFLIIAGFINVGLNILFVTVFHMDVAGVALATIISQTFSAVAVVICLIKEKDFCHLDFRKLRFSSELKEVAIVGIPTSLNSVCFAISNIIIQTAVNGFNDTVIMAGSSTAGNIEGFVYTAMNALYSTAITFTSQNYGAKKYRRIGRVAALCSLVSFVIGAAVSAVIICFASFFSSLYSPEPDVIAQSVERLYTVLPFYVLCGQMEVFAGVMRGMGYSMLPTITTAFGVCVIRLVWVFAIFPLRPSLSWLYWSYPISWALALVINVALFFTVLLHVIKRQRIENDFPVE